MQRFNADTPNNQVAFVAVYAAAALVWPLYFINLFPLSEARDWLIWGDDNAIVQQVFDNLLWRNTRFSRDFSMLAMFGIGRVCGSSILCVNALVTLPLFLSALAFFQLAYVLTERRAASAFITAAWSLSVPFLATAAWQATIHDRIGLLFALCAMTVSWRLRPDASNARLVVYSCLIAALNFGALNSKEAYWFVPPAIVLCHCLRRVPTFTQRSAVREGLVLLPLMAYSAWYFLRYVQAGELSSEWSGHVGSGEIVSNASTYVRRAFGSSGVFVILCALSLHPLRFWRQLELTIRRKFMWCCAVFVLSYAPVARTRFAADYYFLAPLSLMLMLGAITFTNCRVDHLSGWVRWRKEIASLVLAVGLITSHLKPVADLYRERAALANNFRRTLGDTKGLAEDAVTKGALCIAADPLQRQAHLFTDSPFAWNILRWDAHHPLPPQLKLVPTTTASDTQCAQILLDRNLRAVDR